jgi:hypothetical protein
MDRGTLASVFSCATVARHWRTGLFLPTGSTTHVLKREIRCCAYCNYGSCFSLCGEGESGAFFLWDFTCCAGLPLPTCLHPSESEVVYHGLSTRQKARPQGHAKSHSLPLPFLAFFMGYKSAAAQEHPQENAVVPASAYWRTAGHQLPRDGTNGLAKIFIQPFHCCVVIALTASRH